MQNKKRKLSNNSKVITGRPIAYMETVSVLNGNKFVRSSIEFIHMPTCVREYRAAMSALLRTNAVRYLSRIRAAEMAPLSMGS